MMPDSEDSGGDRCLLVVWEYAAPSANVEFSQTSSKLILKHSCLMMCSDKNECSENKKNVFLPVKLS